MNRLFGVANRLIPSPDGINELKYKSGNTDDIIKVIIESDKLIQGDTAKLSQYFKGPQGLRKLWVFVRRHIKYIADTPGHEKIKSPAQTWFDGYGDCKSMSLFVASVLKNLKIPYAYRFVSYANNKRISHVYVVAMPKGKKEIIIDTVHDRFDDQVKYTLKKDYKMTKISYIHGLPGNGSANSDTPKLSFPKKYVAPKFIDFGQMTEGELNLTLVDQQLEMAQKWYGDPTGEYILQRNRINNVLKSGVHQVGVQGISGFSTDLERFVSQHINEAISERRPSAGIFTTSAASNISGIEDCQSSYFGRRTPDPINDDEYYFTVHPGKEAEYKECLLKQEWVPLLNKYLEGAAPHFLYNFISNKDGVNQVVGNKRFAHKNVVGALMQTTGLKRKSLELWLTNGIMRSTSKSNKLGLKSPKELINIIKLTPEDSRVPHVGVIATATVIAILKVVVAILTAAATLAITLKKQPSTKEMLDRFNNLGGPDFGPEPGDFGFDAFNENEEAKRRRREKTGGGGDDDDETKALPIIPIGLGLGAAYLFLTNKK